MPSDRQNHRTEQPYVDTSDGKFVRKDAVFRHWVTPDGSPGPTGDAGFAAQAGRYHLYVSLACPWAHRALIMRTLKGLDAAISVSVVHWMMERPAGWSFQAGPGVIPDPVFDAGHLSEIYFAAEPDYDGRYTVPVLWDKKQKTIVSNESADIIVMLNQAFDHVGAGKQDFYPEAHRREIDAINERVYDTLNNGVYKAGFATTQQAYEEAVAPVFDTLDWLASHLEHRRYLAGHALSIADVRLFTTLIRFDAVYYSHFKCNVRRIADYASLSAYVRDIYQTPGVRDTVDFQHIKGHYYQSMRDINPTRIVPVGPAMDLDAPHGRAQLTA